MKFHVNSLRCLRPANLYIWNNEAESNPAFISRYPPVDVPGFFFLEIFLTTQTILRELFSYRIIFDIYIIKKIIFCLISLIYFLNKFNSVITKLKVLQTYWFSFIAWKIGFPSFRFLCFLIFLEPHFVATWIIEEDKIPSELILPSNISEAMQNRNCSLEILWVFQED